MSILLVEAGNKTRAGVNIQIINDLRKVFHVLDCMNVFKSTTSFVRALSESVSWCHNFVSSTRIQQERMRVQKHYDIIY